jgi:hypothetical protein
MTKKYTGFVAPIIKSVAGGESVGAKMQASGPQGGGALPMAPSGAIALPIPNRSQLDAFNVNREGWEGFTNSLYDSAAYPAAGLTTLSFFNTPQGQGVGLGGGVKTATDTNMNLAGQMPANQEFLIQSLEVMMLPVTPTVAAQMPSVLDAGANALPSLVNDAYIFYRAGNLNLTIGAKSYLQEAPLMKFPPKAFFEVHAALAGTTTADTKSLKISFATARGRPYLLKAPLRLVSNQNFNVTLSWPEGLQVVISPARIVVTLDGVFYRRSQ